MTARVPPVLLTAVVAGLIWAVSQETPPVPIPIVPRQIGASVLTLGGLFLIGPAVHSFRRSKTSLSPFNPASASTLTTSGVYRFSRNPMYLGLLLLLLAWAVYLSSAYSLVLCAGFVFWLNRFQIAPEERALESRFGPDYIAYKERVHRWL